METSVSERPPVIDRERFGPWASLSRAYAYCPTCGNVATVISDGPDDLPWCLHHDGNYVWRSGGMESGWTPMVPCTINVPARKDT